MIRLLNIPKRFVFLGNLTPIEIQTTEQSELDLQISATSDLQKGALGMKPVCDMKIQPGPRGRVSFDVRTVLSSIFSSSIPISAGDVVFSDTIKLVEITVSDETSSADTIFTVLRAGLPDINDYAHVAKTRPLSWQPLRKQFTVNQPEMFSAYLEAGDSIIEHVAIPDGSIKESIIQTVERAGVYIYHVDYAGAKRRAGGDPVWISLRATKHSQQTIFYPSRPGSEDEGWFIWENSLGGVDCFRASGVEGSRVEIEDKASCPSEFVSETYHTNSKLLFDRNTGALDSYSRLWLIDFFRSPRRWVYRRSKLIPITLISADTKRRTDESVSSYSFTYREEQDLPYLDLSSLEAVAPQDLNIYTPSGNFTLPPRPTELPRIQPGEGVLVPAIRTMDGVWGVMHYSALRDDILRLCKIELDTISKKWAQWYADAMQKLSENILNAALFSGDLVVNIEVTDGFVIWNRKYSGTLTAEVFRKPSNVTSQVLAWRWSRNSGETDQERAADVAWMSRRGEDLTKRQLAITAEDIPDTSSETQFSVVATLESGQVASGYVRIQRGENGKDAPVPHIVDGEWYVGDRPTGVFATGAAGADGKAPRISDDGYWEIWNGSRWEQTNVLATGRDGSGHEFVFKAETLEASPTLPPYAIDSSEYQQDDYVPTGWSDDPPELNKNLRYAYVAERKKIGGRWKAFSPPVLWARYSQDGENGKDAPVPRISSGYWYIGDTNTGIKAEGQDGAKGDPGNDGKDGKSPRISNDGYWEIWDATKGRYEKTSILAKGRDGKEHEWIYYRTKTESAPSTPSTSQQDDYVPTGWSDDPPALTPIYKYIYTSEREKKNGVWGSFSTPVIWSRYPLDGVDGKDAHSPKIENGYWWVWNDQTNKYENSGVVATSKSPKIQGDTWWVWNPETGKYEDTHISAIGPKGASGAMFRNRGAYKHGVIYYNNEQYIDVVATENNGKIRYWRVKRKGQIQYSTPPSDYWEELDNQAPFVSAGAIIGKLTSEQIETETLKVGGIRKKFFRLRNNKPSNAQHYEKTWNEFCETLAAGYEVTGIPATGLSLYLPPAELVPLGTRVHFNLPTSGGVAGSAKFLYVGDSTLRTQFDQVVSTQSSPVINPQSSSGFSLQSKWTKGTSLRPMNIELNTSPKPPVLDFQVALSADTGQCFAIDSEIGCFGAHVWVWLNAPDISLQDLVIRGNTKIDVLSTDMIAMRNQLYEKLSVSDLYKHAYAKKSRYIDSSSVTTTIYPSDSVICPAGPLIIRDSSDWAVGSAIEIINHNTSSQIRLTLYSSDAARVSAPLTKTSYSTYSYVYIPAKCIVRAVKVHGQGMWVFYKVGEFSW